VGRADVEAEPVSAPVTRRTVRWLDQRTAAAPLLRKTLRYLFPDHWSFLLGEVALYAFVVLVATGVYLTFFFVDSTKDVVYHGSYAPLRDQHMTEAYASVVNISLTVKAGLLIRQTHHWAANVFVAAIVLHLLRVFFTGAYRKPRGLTYFLGVTMLMLSLLEAYVGYSLVDDLLSGMGLVIGYSVGLSLPFVGASLMNLIFHGPFPGHDVLWPRMYIAHVLLFPILIGSLLTAHLLLVAMRHHTQFRRRRAQTEHALVGVPTWPGQAPRSVGLALGTAGILFLLGGLVQINPIWLWGPYHTYSRRTAPSRTGISAG
jgi:ubiquinol-cytochrome c reductase cytochrome b subunit